MPRRLHAITSRQSKPENLNLLAIARTALDDTEYLIGLSHDLQYTSRQTYDALTGRCRHIRLMLDEVDQSLTEGEGEAPSDEGG